MKYALLVVAILDLFLVAGAAVRWMMTSEQFVGSAASSSYSAPAGGASGQGFGETGRGGQVANHLAGKNVNAVMDDKPGAMAAGPQDSLERGAAITEGREDDLQDAKSKMRTLPGGGG